MPTRTSYAHGTPSWIDLSTTDPAAARAFYGELFGWSFEANPVDGGGEYVMASLADGPVAGLMQQPPEQAEMGLPSMWSTYVTVDDVDATASKVGGAGGSVMAQPFDVMDAGRMAVIVDPAGAVLCLWQANDHIGAHVVNEPGSLVWTELISNDLDASSRFYTALLGWGIEPMEIGPDQPPYSVYTVAGEGIAGGMHPPMEGMPSFWGIYFATGDCDATVAKAESLGATVIAAPMDLPVGRMAALQDPTGAMFSVIAMTALEE